MLGRGVLALVIAAGLLAVAQRRHRRAGQDAPADIGLD